MIPASLSTMMMGGAEAPAPNTLNGADVPAGGTSGTLSNGNKTWTTNTSVGGGATNSNGFTPRPTVPVGAKAYFEFRADSVSIANTGYIYFSIGTGGTSVSIQWDYSGTRRIVGTNTTQITALVNGFVIGVAVDDVNGKIWFSVGGNWITTGTGTPDPAAGTGPAWTYTPGAGHKLILEGRTGNSAQVLTFNFGQTAYAFTPPSGFNNF